MGALLGFAFGVGLILVGSALSMPSSRSFNAPTFSLGARLSHAGMGGVHPRSLLALAALLALVAMILVQLLTRTPPVAVVFASMAGWTPFGVVNARARRRREEIAQIWPEAVDSLASAVRAGMSLAEGLTALGHHGPEALRSAFTGFALDYQLTGRFSESLDRLKERLADPVGDRVVEGLRVAREVGGGDLGRLLRNLSTFLREDLHTRSEMVSRQAWAVNGARLAVAAPWVVLLLMSLQGEAVRRFASPAGVMLLGTGAIACLVAYRTMLRIGRLPTERRVLA